MSDSSNRPQPTARDRDNASARAAIAQKQAEEYGCVLRWARETFGPGWLPCARHFLLELEEEERSRREGTAAQAAATVYTVRHETTDAHRHFMVSDDAQVVEVAGYEEGFGSLLRERHPTRLIEVQGEMVHPYRYNLCWSAIETYHPRSAEQLASLRASRQRGKAERAEKQWAQDHPLLTWAQRQQEPDDSQDQGATRAR